MDSAISRLLSPADGYLFIDNQHSVVDINEAYQQFHLAFNHHIPQTGKKITLSTFDNFPTELSENLFTALTGEVEKTILQVKDLFNPHTFFDVTIVNVKEATASGACMIVKVMEPKTLASFQTPSQEFYKLLVQTSTDVYQLADAGLIVTYTSPAVEQMLGYMPHQLLGRNVLEHIHPDDIDNVKEWMISIRSASDKLFTIEYRVRNSDGEWIWIENNGRNLLHHHEVKAVVMNFRNIQTKKIADHALVQSEQRLSLLLNNTAESFIILNSRLRIITYNKAAQVHSPYFFTQELQSQMSVLDLINKDEVQEYISLFERVFAGEEIEKETKFMDAEGTLHIFNHTYRPLFDQHEDIFGVFITSTNITERKKLTEELATNSERLETAQQIARLAYFEFDFRSKSFFCSDKFYTILGIEQKEYNWLDFRLFEDIAHGDDKERVRHDLDHSFKTGNDFNIEFRISTDDGEKVILAIGGFEKQADGSYLKFRITIQDITDSRMAILAIQTLETRFKSLFENSIDGVILSKQEGDIISGNPSVCRMLGYEHQEITTLNRWDVMDPDSPAVQEMIAKRQSVGSYMGEIMLRHKAGHYVPAEVTSLSMTDGQGVNYISTIIRDITEKKKIEKEQKALTEELLKNNQDLQQFSFITSHNLRAPVANLLSLLSLYNKQNAADEFNQVLIEKFEEATNQLNQTLNDLVNVLVIKSNNNIERETIRLSSVYTEVKRNVENLLAERHGVIDADFSEVDNIHYNRIHIESIFLNMISNAIRYSSPERPPIIHLKSTTIPGWVVVEFTDNGLGMDLNRYGDRLFGLYQRFHENREGKGLGLYMTRSQVMAMGGKIEVESEPGKGTTFKIFFKS
jgi:PAS domain S-box-containing protein